MTYVSKALTFIKDGYLVAVNFAEDHPHIMVLVNVALAVWHLARLVF